MRTHCCIVTVILCLFVLMTVSLAAKEPGSDLEGVTKKHLHSPRFASALQREMVAQFEKQDLVGLAVALVDRDGIAWSGGFGHTSRDGTTRVTTETLFSIGSISKTFTAFAVMRAVQNGKLDLDAAITRYVPGFTVNSMFEKNPATRITLRHLLSHRAGFTHEAPLGNNFDGIACTFASHIASISDTWLKFPVGQRYSYSNLGIDLAGYILRTVSSTPFDRCMKNQVLLPLGMPNSTFNMIAIGQDAQRAIGHEKAFQDVPQSFPMIPAGGLYSNVNEMSRFVQMMLNQGAVDGVQVLNTGFLAEMTAIQFPEDGQLGGYCLGVGRGKAVNHKLLKHDYLIHLGGGFGFRSVMRWFPEYGFGYVILSNNRHFQSWPIRNLILKEVIEKTADPYLKPAFRKENRVAPDQATRKKLAGRYGDLEMVLRNMEISLSWRGKSYPLHFISPDTAFVKRKLWGRNQPDQELFKFASHKDGSAAWIHELILGDYYVYQDHSKDTPGPNKEEWRRYVGTYQWRQWGRNIGKKRVEIREGHLSWEGTRLQEHLPGLFFTPDGEALDLRGETPTFRNIKIYPISNE